jgi:hypothetical protein
MIPSSVSLQKSVGKYIENSSANKYRVRRILLALYQDKSHMSSGLCMGKTLLEIPLETAEDTPQVRLEGAA